MSTNGQADLITHMTGLLADPGYQNELAQVRAKATLQAIGEATPPPRWTYVGRRFARNSAAAVYALEALAIHDPSGVEQFKDEARRVALAWENLAKLGEGLSRPLALLNAALAYELAGYQANATYLAREVLPRLDADVQPDLYALVSSFLQRRLLLTWRLSEQLRRQPSRCFTRAGRAGVKARRDGPGRCSFESLPLLLEWFDVFIRSEPTSPRRIGGYFFEAGCSS